MWRARGKNGKEKADPSRMEIKRFESLLELTVYLFGYKSDNENVRTLNRSKSHAIIRLWFSIDESSISFLLFSHELDLPSFRNFCIRDLESRVSRFALFFFRKKIIYPNSRFHFCGQFFLPQSEAIKLFVFLPIDVSPCLSARVSCSRKRGTTRDYASPASGLRQKT